MQYLSPMRALPVLFLALGVSPLAGQTPRNWRPEDRVVIADWTHISAVAAGPDRVFIVSPAAVLVWHPQFRRWEGPFDPPVPDVLAQVNAGMIDPLDNTLWLQTLNGWVHFQPDLQLWDRGTAPGRVIDIAFDLAAPTEGLFLRTPDGWYMVPRGGFTAVAANPPVRPIRPASVSQAVASNPVLQGGATSFLLDPSLQSARLTSAARSFDNLGWYLGTDRVGTLFLPDGAAVPDRLSFGLPGRIAGAVMAVPGGVWVATDRAAAAPAGLTFVAGDLSDFQVITGPAATGLPFTRVRRLIGVESSIWAASDGGVIRFPTSDPTLYTAYTEGMGVPDRRVLSLASRRGVVVAATARGLARFADTAGAAPLAPAFVEPALAVALGGDTTWVATRYGPRAALADDRDLWRPPGLDSSAAFNRSLYDLAWMADTLVGLTVDQFLWKAPGADRWELSPTISSILGPLRRMVVDGDGFWVAGDLAVGWTRINGVPIRPLLVGSDLPGDPLDMAVDADFLWVATTGGLVRFRLSEVRP